MTNLITPTRRGFLGLLAAPAIIRVASIMPVRSLPAATIFEGKIVGTTMAAREVAYFEAVRIWLENNRILTEFNKQYVEEEAIKSLTTQRIA